MHLLLLRNFIFFCGLQGAANKNGTCQTCGGTFDQCPGHFGYLHLELPVFNFGYLSTIVDILKCICKVIAYVYVHVEHLNLCLILFTCYFNTVISFLIVCLSGVGLWDIKSPIGNLFGKQ